MEASIEHVIYKKQRRIFLRFDYDRALIAEVKKLPGARWSHSQRVWHTNHNDDVLKSILALFAAKGIALLNKGQLCEPGVLAGRQTLSAELPGTGALIKINDFSNWLRSRRYSDNTVKTYTEAIRVFFRHIGNKPFAEVSNEDIILFNNHYILARRHSASYQNQVVNALKLFYKTIDNKVIDLEKIHRPKREKILPNVLSKQEVKIILNAHANIKHRAMLSLIYGCGLRCGELLRLEPRHVDSKRNVLIIRQAKGRKDRIAPLSGKIIELLRAYFNVYKPAHFLFEGQKKGTPYDERSLQNVLKQALQKGKISKPVSLHWLRHSYATHLLEQGTDLRYIQEILGHASSKTTEIYTHVSTHQIQKITPPFDYL